MKFITNRIVDLTEVDVFDRIPQLRQRLQTTDVPAKLALAYLGAAIVMTLMPFDFISHRILAILAFVVPAYKTYAALNYKDREAEELLIAYWVTYVIAMNLHWIIFFVPCLVKLYVMCKLYNNKSRWALITFQRISKLALGFEERITAAVIKFSEKINVYVVPVAELLSKDPHLVPSLSRMSSFNEPGTPVARPKRD